MVPPPLYQRDLEGIDLSHEVKSQLADLGKLARMVSVAIFRGRARPHPAIEPAFGRVCQTQVSDSFKARFALFIAHPDLEDLSLFATRHQRTRLLNDRGFLTLMRAELNHPQTLTVYLNQVASEEMRSVPGSALGNHRNERYFAVPCTMRELALPELDVSHGT